MPRMRRFIRPATAFVMYKGQPHQHAPTAEPGRGIISSLKSLVSGGPVRGRKLSKRQMAAAQNRPNFHSQMSRSRGYFPNPISRARWPREPGPRRPVALTPEQLYAARAVAYAAGTRAAQASKPKKTRKTSLTRILLGDKLINNLIKF